ncbi:MAG: hypothetical protein FJ291_13200 [Planctomycetes bacterium]|nr:hypothetical protein [Planctomycetota bacterium]
MQCHTGLAQRTNWLAMGAALVAAGILVLAPLGCEEMFGKKKPKGLVRLGTGCLVVLPFATPNKKHFESELGSTFSTMIADLVREGCPGAKVLDARTLPAQANGQPIEKASLVDIGQALGANYVVIGEIHELTAKEPGAYKVLKGTMVISAWVFDCSDGSVPWRIVQRKYHYPRLLGGEAIPAPSDDEEEVITRVMREAAWGVAAVFRGARTDEQLRLGD